MEKEFRYGQMEQGMKANGGRIRLMDQENFGM